MKNSFCFIVCTNKELWFQECEAYIRRLIVPNGYSVEILAVTEAVSMTSGYNEGMNASDAQYKIYLHQDTFVINPYFLFELLNIFSSNQSIGLIGIVGSPKLPVDGVMWHGPRGGALYVQTPLSPNFIKQAPPTEPPICMEVECADGLMLITNRDLPWRSDLFDAWDFYDISQCFEFRKAGYKVVIPMVESPWVIHDASPVQLWNYDKYRQLFLNEYADMLTKPKA